MQSVSALDLPRLAARYLELEKEIRQQLVLDGFAEDELRFMRFADCRYRGQGHELRTPGPAGPIQNEFVSDLREAFDEEHRRAYGHAYPDRDMQIVNIRVIGIGSVAELKNISIEKGTSQPPADALIAAPLAVFDLEGKANAIETPRYLRDRLRANNRIIGPAIIDQMDTTTVLPPGFSGSVDRFGNLLISSA
jgi:5-oxoprolinase (ATP-hydrolysing)